jgi:hypothetical protein
MLVEHLLPSIAPEDLPTAELQAIREGGHQVSDEIRSARVDDEVLRVVVA